MFLKDPTDPKWRNDAGVKLYRQILKRYAPGANANDPYHVYGMAAAYTFVEALKKAGKTPTRESLVKAVASLNLTKNPFMIPGIFVKTGPERPLPDRADAAPALAEERLAELRRALGLPLAPEGRRAFTTRTASACASRAAALGWSGTELPTRSGSAVRHDVGAMSAQTRA